MMQETMSILFKMWCNTSTLGSETNMFAKQTLFDLGACSGGHSTVILS